MWCGFCGAADDPAAAAFDQLRDARGLEYELDRVANRAARDKQVSRDCFGAHMNCCCCIVVV